MNHKRMFTGAKRKKSANVVKVLPKVFVSHTGAKGVVHERIARRSLVELSTGEHKWYDDLDLMSMGE